MPQILMSHAPARRLQQTALHAIAADGAKRSDAVEVRIEPLWDLAATEAAWRDLEARAAPSFFLSWLWIGTWLAHLPKDAEPHLLVARTHERIVGMAVMCRGKAWRLGLRPRARWLLHETGDPHFDRLSIEYNGILADRSAAEAITAACLASAVRHLGQSDLLVLSGITSDMETVSGRTAADAGLMAEVTATDTAHWVDFVEIRRLGKDYRGSLGRNTRQAVSRSLRLYSERGPVEHHVMETVPEALAAFTELAELHRARWGRKGAFANPAFGPFHEDLIARGVPSGAVRISRTTVGGRTIGVLYNFVHGGEILHYQSGFLYEEDAKLKPGVLSHVLAIEESFARGELGYDFMAGSAGHKSRLANAQRFLKWVVVGRDTIERRIEARVRHAKHALAQFRKSGE
jgi:CelD/BcsL family acetyltransferase involved in cellulose biosynthesis